jgi:hypothetical protein
MVSLDQLPQAALRRILKYLLVAEHVRQPPNHLLVENYAFQVNVLRVNKAINKEGTVVLYMENAFIKVQSDFIDAEKSMHNHEVPFFKLKRKFEHHVADVTIKFDPMNKRLIDTMQSKRPVRFLLLLEDLTKYTRLLRLLDLANFMSYQFDFKLHQPPLNSTGILVELQRKLMMPFKVLRGSAMNQIVTFDASINKAIVRRVKQAMTQKVAWLRAGAWEIHDIALSIKRMGDWAFALGNADMALAKYEDTRTFLDTALTTNSMMKRVNDNVHLSMWGIECTTWVDTALLMLSDTTLKETGKRVYDAVPIMVKHIEAAERAAAKNHPVVPVPVIARFYHLLGIAELGLNHPIKAVKAFAKSYKMVSDKDTKDGYETALRWKGLGKTEQIDRLKAALATMPAKPCDIPDMKEYCTPEVASEQWVMRELGFQGPFPYEDKIKGSYNVILTNKPHPNHHNQGPRTAQIGHVKPEVLQKHVDMYRKQMNLPIAKGRLTCCVCLSADDIGEETVLDHPDFVDAMKNMHMSGNACNPQ